MGADPTASPVTGECSTVELRPHEDKIAEILFFYNLFLVPMNGIEPFFEAYESPVLPLNYIGILHYVPPTTTSTYTNKIVSLI